MTDEMLQEEIDQVSQEKKYPLGTRLVNYAAGPYPFRYAQAGDDLKRGFPVFAHYEGEVRKDADGHLIWGEEESEGMWADIRPEGDQGQLVGWPTVDVAKGLFFWLRVIV